MKAIYRELTMREQLDTLIANAVLPVQEIRLTADELKKFCDESGYAFQKGCHYTHKGYWITYDWDSK